MAGGMGLQRQAAAVLQRKGKLPYPGRILSLEEIAKDPEREKKRDNTKQTEARVCRSIGEGSTKQNCPAALAPGDKVSVIAEKIAGLWLQIENTGFAGLGPKEPANVLGAFVEAEAVPPPLAKSHVAIPPLISFQQPPSIVQPVAIDVDAVVEKALKNGPSSLSSQEADALMQRFGGKQEIEKRFGILPPPTVRTFDVPGDMSAAPLQLDALRKNDPFGFPHGADIQLSPQVGIFPLGQQRTNVTVDSNPQQTEIRDAINASPALVALLSAYFVPGTDPETIQPKDAAAKLRASRIWKRLQSLKPEDRDAFTDKAKHRMESWDQFDQELSEFIKPIEMAQRKEQDKAEASSRAEKLVRDDDNETLGRDLLNFTLSGETQTVLAASGRYRVVIPG